jgi:hypothetical protein
MNFTYFAIISFLSLKITNVLMVQNFELMPDTFQVMEINITEFYIDK